jgi:hypothetical protein
MSPTGLGDELAAEGQVLEHQMASRAHGREERRQEGYEKAEHRAGENPGPRKNRQWLQSGRSAGEAQALVQDDDVVEKFLVPRPDHRRQPGREEGVATEDQEARRRLEGKGLAKLLCDPGSSRTGGDGAADHVAPAVAGVHRGDAVSVVPEEGRPGGVGSRRARQGTQVAGDAALGDIEAEAKQFPADAGRPRGSRLPSSG